MRKFEFILILLLGCFANIVYANPDSLQQKIDYYFSKADFSGAKNYIQERLKDSQQKPNSNFLNYQLVKVLFIQSDYDAALKQAFISLDEMDDNKQRVNINFLIGCIYSAIKDYGKSIEYFNFVVGASQDSSLLVKTHLLSSELHLELKDSTSAQQSLNQAFHLTNLYPVDPAIKNHVSIQYNFFNHNYELCKQQNLNIIRDTSNFLNTRSYAYAMIGDCLIKQDSLLPATNYLEKFLSLTLQTNDPEQVKIAANKLIDVYEKLGAQEKANTYHKIYNEAMSDSLSFSVEKYRDLYQVEKDRELAISTTKATRNKLLWGMCILLIGSLGFYYFFKKKKATNESQEPIKKAPSKQFVISDLELEKIKKAVNQLISEQLFLRHKITRKSFCLNNKIKSERYVSHYINTEYNKSFSIFINDLRIEYAYSRIQNDSQFRNYKIEEIAKESGFGSKKSFERAFLAKYNETPYKFIKSVTD